MPRRLKSASTAGNRPKRNCGSYSRSSAGDTGSCNPARFGRCHRERAADLVRRRGTRSNSAASASRSSRPRISAVKGRLAWLNTKAEKNSDPARYSNGRFAAVLRRPKGRGGNNTCRRRRRADFEPARPRRTATICKSRKLPPSICKTCTARRRRSKTAAGFDTRNWPADRGSPCRNRSAPGLRCPLGEGRSFLAHPPLRYEHLTAEASRLAAGQVRAFEQGIDVMAFEVRLFAEPVA